MFFLNKFINKLAIISLIIISFYNIFSILMVSFSSKIDGNLVKVFDYLPYKYSIFFIGFGVIVLSESALGYVTNNLMNNSLIIILPLSLISILYFIFIYQLKSCNRKL